MHPLSPRRYSTQTNGELPLDAGQCPSPDLPDFDLFDRGPIGHLTATLEGGLTRVNGALAAMLGRSESELEQCSLVDLVVGAEAAALSKTLQALPIGEQRVSSSSWLLQHSDGSTVYTQITFAVLYDGSGAAQSLSGLVVDVSPQVTAAQQLEAAHAELRAAEAAARHQAMTLDAVLNSVSDGVSAVDENGAFLLYNPAATRMLGAVDSNDDPAEWQQHYGIFRSDGVTPFPSEELPLLRGLAGLPSDRVEMVIRNAGQPEGRTISVSGRPLEGVAGQRGAVAIFHDVSDSKRAEAQLRQQQAQLRAILTTASDAFVGMGEDGRVTDWNPAAEAMLGWSADQAIGALLADLIMPVDQRAAHAAALERFLTHGVRSLPPRPIELQAVHRDGHEFPVELVVSPWRAVSGWRFHGFMRDVSERRAAERTMRTLAQVVEHSGDAICSLDMKGTLTSWNQAAQRLFGYTAEEVLGTMLDQLVPDGLEAELATLQREVIASRSEQLIETQRLCKNGECVDVALSLSPLFDETGVQVGFAKSMRDIGDRLRVEVKLRQSEKVFRDAFDNSLTGMTLTGIDGRFQRVNPVFAAMLGRTPDALVGVHYSAVTDPEVDDGGPARIARALAGETEAFRLEKCYRHADGSPVWVELSTALIRDVGGQPLYFATQMVDITARRSAQRERDTRDLMLRGVIANSQSLIYVKDLEGRYLLANEPFERAFSVKESDLLGQDDTYLDPELAPVWRLNDLRAQVQEYRVDEWSDAADGRHYYDSVKFPLRDPDGQAYATCGISLDVTARRLDREALTRARDEALAANAAKSSFLATMSHEIRTPMNAVIGMSGLLLDSGLSRDQRELAETVRDSGQALLSLINDILDFSKIESGDLDLDHHPFNVRDCVESALTLVSVVASTKRLELIGTVEDCCPQLVLGDVTRLRQVLVNLLSNAVKFTSAGEVLIQVGCQPLSVSADGPVLMQFAVTDTGVGIPPDRLDRLFQPFSQVDTSTTRVYGGTGLGLAICRRLADAMGGDLRVETELGVGSTFTLTVVLTGAVGAPPHPSTDVSDVRGKTALIVDDNATSRRALRHQVERWGMTCVDVDSAVTALALPDPARPFDVVLVDSEMPAMGGRELARHLRTDPARGGIPVILLNSVHRRVPHQDQDVIDAVVTKPLRRAALLDALRSVLRMSASGAASGALAGAAAKPAGAPVRAGSLRILLAEDNPINQRVAQLMLAKLGHLVDTVSNGVEAVEAVRRAPYDVVLMDLQMPQMDGLEASRRIRAELPQSRQPRIVALTANALVEDRTACEKAGMDDYLAKPVISEDLSAALTRVRTAIASGTAVARQQPAEPTAGDPETDIRRRVQQLLGKQPERSRGLIADILELFLTDTPLGIAALQDAVSRVDVQGIEAGAHSLKGSTSNFGAVTLASMCEQLEISGRSGVLEGTRELIAAVTAEYDTVQAVLMEVMAELRVPAG